MSRGSLSVSRDLPLMANHAPLSSASSPFLTPNTFPTSRAAKYACARVLCLFSVSMSLSVCLCVCDSSSFAHVLSNKTFSRWIFQSENYKDQRFIKLGNTTLSLSTLSLSLLYLCLLTALILLIYLTFPPCSLAPKPLPLLTKPPSLLTKPLPPPTKPLPLLTLVEADETTRG